MKKWRMKQNENYNKTYLAFMITMELETGIPSDRYPLIILAK